MATNVAEKPNSFYVLSPSFETLSQVFGTLSLPYAALSASFGALSQKFFVLSHTPGMRELQLWDVEASAIDTAFADIAAIAARCRFRDCGSRRVSL